MLQVSIFVTAQDSSSKSLDAEHFLHHFTDKEMVTIAVHRFTDFGIALPLTFNNSDVADLFC
jgi:hypothetical protein